MANRKQDGGCSQRRLGPAFELEKAPSASDEAGDRVCVYPGRSAWYYSDTVDRLTIPRD